MKIGPTQFVSSKMISGEIGYKDLVVRFVYSYLFVILRSSGRHVSFIPKSGFLEFGPDAKENLPSGINWFEKAQIITMKRNYGYRSYEARIEQTDYPSCR